MEYATPTQLANVGLTSRALKDITVADQKAALEMATDVISGYLNKRFTLPLAAWGKDVTRACCVLAAYDLRVSRGFNPAPGSSDEELRLRLEEVTRWLELVAKGVVVPVGIVDSSTTPNVGDDRFSVQAESDPPRGW
jgi:phage gp36-like protein